MKIKLLLLLMITPLSAGESLLCLANPTSNRVVAVMKESNLHNAPMEWQASKSSYELVNGFLMRRLHLEPQGGFPTNTGENPVDLDETVSLTSKCVALPFESVVMHGRTQ